MFNLCQLADKWVGASLALSVGVGVREENFWHVFVDKPEPPQILGNIVLIATVKKL